MDGYRRHARFDVEMPGPEGNGLGGMLPETDPDRAEEHEPSAAEEVLDAEEDRQSAENDDLMIKGRSPEFQHLTRSSHGGRS